MTVLQPLPVEGLDDLDPFLLLHHHGPVRFAGGGDPSTAGVPPHPHRGFDPVTFIYRGGVHHRDSLGNSSVVRAGGVQWTTTGRGIVHSERPPRALVEEGGEQEIIQLWVNVPSARRMTEPRYQPLDPEDIPVVTSADGRVRVQVVAGIFDGVRGPAETLSPITALNAELQAGGVHTFVLPEGHNAFLYLLDGRVRLNAAQPVDGAQLAVLDPEGEAVHVEAERDTRLLLMTGEPLGEPYVASGPFVVDSVQDVRQAMHDYRHGRMGTLTETF